MNRVRKEFECGGVVGPQEYFVSPRPIPAGNLGLGTCDSDLGLV